MKLPDKEGRHDVAMAVPVADADWHLRTSAVPHLYFEGERGAATAVGVALELGNGWAVYLEFRPRDGRLVLVQADFREVSVDADVEFGSRMMRRAGYGAAETAAREAMRDYVVATTFLGEPWAQPVRRPGRRGRDAVEWALWAKRYVDALQVNPRAPVRQIVDDAAARGEFLTEAEVRSKVGRTRPRFLTRSPEPGKAGGELTPEAIELLEQLNGEGIDGER